MTARIHYTPAAIAAHEAAINEAEWQARDDAREQAFFQAVGRVLIVGCIGLSTFALYALSVS